MRIVLLTAEYPPASGGIGDYTQQLGGALVARGHDVHVATICDLRFTMYDVRLGATNTEPVQLIDRRVSWNWASWPVVIEALDRMRPDVLHIQYQTGAFGMHPAINGLPWRLRGLRGRPAVIVTAHDLLDPYLFPKAGPLRTWVTRRLLNDADAAIATNDDDLQRAHRLGCAAHIIPIGSNITPLLRNESDRRAVRAELGVTTHTPLVAYFGLLGSSKGVDTLITALVQLPAAFHLVIIGGEATAPHDRAYAAAVRTQIAACGLADRVTITGQVTASAVSRYLYAADIAALPFSDGASFRRGSLLAALTHGLPVVTTAGSTVPSQLRDGENVLLVPAGDAGALAMALARLAADSALRARLGQAGQALAAQFSWEAIAARHEAVYEETRRQEDKKIRR